MDTLHRTSDKRFPSDDRRRALDRAHHATTAQRHALDPRVFGPSVQSSQPANNSPATLIESILRRYNGESVRIEVVAKDNGTKPAPWPRLAERRAPIWLRNVMIALGIPVGWLALLWILGSIARTCGGTETP